MHVFYIRIKKYKIKEINQTSNLDFILLYHFFVQINTNWYQLIPNIANFSIFFTFFYLL